jgi:hypothetical protein
MAKTLNLTAEEEANIIGSETTPLLSLENTSTGNALFAKNTSTGSAVKVEATASTSPTVELRSGTGTTIGAVTVAPLKLVASGVSAAILEVAGNALISCTTGGATAFALRVKHGDNYYYIPMSTSVVGVAIA